MTAATDWSRVKALFSQAQEMPATERDAWLVQQCGDAAALLVEVRSLLAAQSGPGTEFTSGGGALLVAPILAAEMAAAVPRPGTLVGPYRLLRLLGEGGMGRVFLAERIDGQFEQQVALKLIRSEFASPELHARFLRERALLARLAHPNIAPLHDGGVAADGAPYFTLEYVEGEPITRWCDARQLAIAPRLRLWLKVCDAVQYAHRNLIVHRDLKPSNILVSADGEPKLLDFGIAKPLSADAPSAGLTGTETRPMTREYAAPEQVLGEPITTATDVYTLGVVMYELLCGRLPYARAERGESSWPKAIVEEAPETLVRAVERSAAATPGTQAKAEIDVTTAAARGHTVATLRRTLRGDLDRIAQRALEKAPDARYPSVTALAEDVRAHLEGRALPGGNRRYRLMKFLRRNRIAASMASVLFAVLVAGLVAIALEEHRIASEAQAKLHERQATAAVKDFLLDLFHRADPNVAKGKEISARELVDRGVQRLDKISADQADLKAELQATLGTIYFQLGLYKEAAVLHEQAFAALSASGANPPLAAHAERDWATELVHLGKLAQARQLADDSVQRLRAMAQPPVADLVHSLATVGWIAESERDGERAVRAAGEAIALARREPVDDGLLALALDRQGSAYWVIHDNEAAAVAYREALELHSKTVGPDDRMTLMERDGLATALYASGHFADATESFRKSYESYARIFGASNLYTLHAEEGLALVEHDSGDYKASRHDFEQILATLADKPLQNEQLQTEVSLNLGLLLADSGDLDAAERMIAAARDAFEHRFGAKFPSVTEAVSDLGYVYTLQGKLYIAEEQLRSALADKAERKDDDTADEWMLLSDVYRLRGDAAQAVTLGSDARDNALKLYGERSRQAARSHYYVGVALVAANRNDDAERELRASLQSFALLVPPDGLHPFSAGPRLALGQVLAAQSGHRDEALALLRQALKLRSDTFGKDHALTLTASKALADALRNAP